MRFPLSPRRSAGAVAAICISFAVWPPAAPAAAAPCWKTVVADWSKDGSIDGRYSLACFRAAEQNAPADLRIYSTLEDDLRRAVQARVARHVSGTVLRPRLDASNLPPASSPSSLAMLGALVGVLAGLLAAIWLAVTLARRYRIRSG